ncbi:hypothetical protein PVAG01_10588 [Phlyctema vagabunda]|uniref:Uncharacterized protein n=1 Tax=Phlyctema vagabunda TaxID=108571 RepID=A0ABR4P2Q0_9HELO
MINPQQNPTATGSALRAQDDVLGDQLVEFFSPLRSQDHLMMPEIQPLTPTRVSGDRSAMTTREQDRLQRVSEVATRTFHSTMDQKKPRPSTSTTKTTLKQKATAHLERPDDVPRQVSTFSAHVDPLPEFSRTTENSIYNMLERLRGFQGELTVNAELGRIIMRKLKTRDITEKKSTPRTITAEDLHRDLLATKHDPRDGPFIRFTNILTTLPADIDLLVAMQDSDRYDLWNKQPATWDVVYELDCTVVEHGIKTPFTIKIDAEKFTYTLVKKLDLAAIFIHCVKRNWDVQVTATGSVPMSMYDEHVLPILDTLYAKQGTQPYLEFTSSCSNLLTIHTGRVRRSCQYAAQGKFKSRLNVTQIQELSIEYDQAIEGIQNFRAFYPDPSHRRQPGEEGTWFEVNVSSTVLEEHLKENMQIEFGDKTSWDVQKLMADNVASAIIEPALLMVQRADGVGFWNNNLQQKPVSQPAQATPPVKPRGYQFW